MAPTGVDAEVNAVPFDGGGCSTGIVRPGDVGGGLDGCGGGRDGGGGGGGDLDGGGGGDLDGGGGGDSDGGGEGCLVAMRETCTLLLLFESTNAT